MPLTRREGERVPDFSNSLETTNWLLHQSREVRIALAARAALRVVPVLDVALGPRGGQAEKAAGRIMLPVFRAAAVPWVVANYPLHSTNLRDAAAAATGAAEVTAASVYDVAAARASASAAARASATCVYAVRDSDPPSAYHAADTCHYAALAVPTAIDTAADAEVLGLGIAPAVVARRPLWLTHMPAGVDDNWQRLAWTLLEAKQDWEVWTEWYEGRLEGRPANEALEVARVMIADAMWHQGPGVVNSEIKRLIDQHRARTPSRQPDLPIFELPSEPPPFPIDLVPSQGPGPRFRATDEGPVDRAPSADQDAEGNDTKTINRLKPLALRCAADLKTRLPPNQFGELLSAVDLYVTALSPAEGKVIEWGEVWGLGVYLQNAAASAERKVDDRILPALEDPAKTALESLLTIHGPMILATQDGARFSEQASSFQLTRDQQEALRAAAQRVADQLKADKHVITPRAAESVERATESIGQGPHPERGSVYGLATIKNISIVLVGGAAIATPALIGALLGSVVIGAAAGAPLSLVAVEAVKKSAAFNALVTQLGAKLDSITDDELRAWLEERSRRYAPFRRFVARNAEPLRKIAEATPELKWMLRYIDFIV